MSRHNNNKTPYFRNPIIKNRLIDYIFNVVDISKFKYSVIEFNHDLDKINPSMYKTVSPNYNGINSLMVFIRLRNRYYSFLIGRKSLSYGRDKIDIDKIRIYPINIRLDKSVYNGTIIDGTLLHNGGNYSHHQERKFVVNDIYSFLGESFVTDIIADKLQNIKLFINAYYKTDLRVNNIEITINKLTPLKDINNLLKKTIPSSKYTKDIKGIAFHPIVSGTKLIYLFNNNVEIKKKIKYTDVRSSRVVTTVDTITAIFRLNKTDISDVYHIYLIKKLKKGGKKIIKYKKYDIAYLPTMEVSYFCKDLFNATDEDHVMVECKYNVDKKKWTPIKHIKDKKFPFTLKKVEKMLII